ncbi:MAG: acyl-CoA dehydrogenase family protein, partial [Spongiibacteraceae bacterium]|nr:acyl-CoA dehydrogenase family protein [Spongiibacteraceae bacterium]
MSELLGELRDSAQQVVSDVGVAAKESDLWPLIGELGWLLSSVPETLGGLELGLSGSCILHTELGRGLSTVPFLSASLVLDAVVQGSAKNKTELIAQITAGDCVTVSLTETCELKLDGEILSGKVMVVPSADKASNLLIYLDDCVALINLDQA